MFCVYIYFPRLMSLLFSQREAQAGTDILLLIIISLGMGQKVSERKKKSKKKIFENFPSLFSMSGRCERREQLNVYRTVGAYHQCRVQ
jgi:hypothetical protein